MWSDTNKPNNYHSYAYQNFSVVKFNLIVQRDLYLLFDHVISQFHHKSVQLNRFITENAIDIQNIQLGGFYGIVYQPKVFLNTGQLEVNILNLTKTVSF